MKTLRAFLKRVQAVERAEAFTIAVARQLITLGRVDWHVLFFDGHFIPYFGQHAIRHGYFTVRRLAIKGQQAFYANDRRGRPLLVLLQPGSAKLPKGRDSRNDRPAQAHRRFVLGTLGLDRGI